VGQLQELIYACLVRGLVKAGVAPLEAFSACHRDRGDGPLAEPDAAQPGESGGGGGGGAPAPTPDGDPTDAALFGAGWDWRFARRGLLWDARTGDLLQLGAEGRVLAAWHGFRRVPDSVLARRYPGGQWWARGHMMTRGKHPDFAALHTFFDAPCALTLVQLVKWEDDTQRRGAPRSGTPDDTYGHLFRAHLPVFDHIFDNEGAFPGGRGGFFGALRARPARFILRRPALAAALRAARKRGVRVVLATNSSEDFARFVLAATLGGAWRECFCAVVYACQKPQWFLGAGAGALRPAKGAPAPPLGWAGSRPLLLAAEPLPCVEWAAGCAEDLRVALDRGWAWDAACRERHRTWFAGDHLFGDVAASAAFGWSAVAVVQELEEEGEGAQHWAPLLGAAGDEATFWRGLLEREAAVTVSDAVALLTLAEALREEAARERAQREQNARPRASA